MKDIIRRVFLFVFAMMTVLPVISQDEIRIRSCRPGLENTERAHTARRASALTGTNRAAANPYIGDRRQLVVMAAFADKGFLGDSAQTMTQWNKIFNTKYLSEDSLYGSVYDYFVDQSYEQFRITFDLHYATVDSMIKYHSTKINDENSRFLVQDVVQLLDNKVDDWAPYDWDGDSYVDQLLIIYAGKGQQDGGNDSTIWAHQWWMSEHDDSEPVKVNGADKEYFIDSYCCTQELSGKGDYGSFGTLCHEYSHCFGLPDFYYGSSCIVGSWDLMDNGNYNGDGFRPCGYSAFERAFMGWLTPEELTGKTSVDGLPALSTQPKAYIVRNDGHPDEYYVIENRQKIGWDEKLPGSGILIFHVDYDDYIFRHAAPNERIKRYTIFPANNKTVATKDNIKGWAYPNNGNNSLTITSEPAAELNNMNTDSTLYMNKPITGMAVVSSMAQFKFCYPIENGMVPATEEPAKDHGWFTIDGRQLLAPPTGKGMYIHDGKLLLIK